MMRTVLFVCFLGCVFQIQAQVRLAPVLGYNLFNNTTKITESTNRPAYGDVNYRRTAHSWLDEKPKSGYQVGVLVDIGIKNAFHLHTGLLYEQIAGTNTYAYSRRIFEATVYNAYFEELFKLRYLSIPLFLNYTPQAGRGKLNLFMGPQFSFFTGGRYKADVKYIIYENQFTYIDPDPRRYSRTEEGSIKVGQGEYDVDVPSSLSVLHYDPFFDPNKTPVPRYANWLNVSLNVGMGYEYKSTLFRIYYTYSLTSAEPENYRRINNYSVFYHGINFSLAYFLFGKEKKVVAN